jgi:hypothetical protein
MSNLARRFVEAVTQQFEAPDEALAWLQPEVERLKEKDEKRRIQRRGSRVTSGNPRGRPRLTGEQELESKERRRALHREWMAARAAAAPRKSTSSSTRADAHRHRSDAWPSRRRSSRDSLDHRSSGRRLLGRRRRLRQRWSASVSSPARHGSGHPEQSDPQATSSVRRDSLSPTQSHRAHVLPPQGLETHRHPL